MSTHDRQTTPPQDPEKVQAHLKSQQSTKPNKGSSASGQLLGKVRKETVKLGINTDMNQRKYCDPEDMIRFLLALCCQDEPSTTPVARGQVLDDCFEVCWREVIPVANSDELRQRLDDYKSSSSTYEWDMYLPFTEALNYALEHLSNIRVNGLPKFKTHIAFVPCNKGVTSGRSLQGSSFKPDIAVMSLQDAREFHGLNQLDTPKASQFIGEITGKSPPGFVSWKTVLSAVEVKRKKDASDWASLKVFNYQERQVNVMRDADQRLDEEPDTPQPTTPVSSATLVSTKRSASAAGMEAGTEIPSSKRQRVQDSIKAATQALAAQNGIYAAEKFSDSFSISHVLNLLVENDCLWISWIDREGAIFSSGFSFFKNLPLTLVLLLVLQRFGPRQWGHIPELTTPNHTISLHPVNDDKTLGKDEIVVNFYPEDKVHSSWSLLGRATTVVGANRKVENDSGNAEGECVEVQGETKDGAVGGAPRKDLEDVQQTKGGAGKDAGSGNDTSSAGTTEYNPSDAMNDPAVVEAFRAYNQARDAYRGASSNIAKAHDLVLKVSWPEASRPEEWKIIGHAQTLGKTDKFIEGHIPVVYHTRDFGQYSTCHIRDFLGIKPAESEGSGTRTLRLIVMKRLQPIYDLDGEQFWNAFWQCVACHYRLWVNGIHHGDISYNNLMYDVPGKTGDPVGIINDFDLATWVDHSTTNNDRTGTIPFMAIDLLDGGLDDCIPRLYRHDMESFVWVLAFITVARITYGDRTIKISPLPKVDTWFKDKDLPERDAHISSKRLFHLEYGHSQRVSGRYYRYRSVVQQMIRHWDSFHQSLRDIKYTPRPELPIPMIEEPITRVPEVDDPMGSLTMFIGTVEVLLGGQGAVEGFTEVKALLLEVIETSATAVKAV
ncbi:hypothetical protein BDM02DRAFT_3270005 [Thelephora ganbajun]|uniref:Uncharacterized protein n=1 Tax=Thelephora ganbajun TaxID=370292 RepID=A0ACB6ZE38_THEGA|nr:hypothetical protein BDM02DRAFT_3270005 [Thelephora ganbajun]